MLEGVDGMEGVVKPVVSVSSLVSAKEEQSLSSPASAPGLPQDGTRPTQLRGIPPDM